MRPASKVAILIAFGLVTIPAAVTADEPSFLGRIFRRVPASAAPARRVDPTRDRDRERISAELLKPPADPDSVRPLAVKPTTPPAEMVPAPANGDPMLARYAVGRATDGTTFGMFLQVYADGTVMDSSGLHHADPARLDTLNEALASLPLEDLDHHYAGPAAGDLEVIQLVVYRRSKGKLQAYPFSYSGNPSTAPEAIRQLHSALEAFEMHLIGETASHEPIARNPSLTSFPPRGLQPSAAEDLAPPPPLVAPR